MWVSKKKWEEMERRLNELERIVKPSPEDSVKNLVEAMKVMREHKKIELESKF